MNIKMIGAAILAGAMVAGCGAKDGEGEKAKADEAVLAVNGEKLMRSEIDTDIEKLLKAQGDKVPAEQRDYFKQMVQNQIAQSFIVEKVLVAKAKAEGYTVSDADRKERGEQFLKAMAKQPNAPKSVEEYFKSFPLGEARARTEFENGILIDKMIKAAQAKAPAAANDEKVKKIIEDAKANNAKAATAEADAKKKIADLKAQLAKVAEKDLPAKFAELAKANSDCPSKDKGGDLGEFTHGQMVKEFDEVAFKLPVNKVSDPVKTQFGYHLVMTTKKIPAVEAKDGKPAEPEKVQASHILVKVPEVQPVPKAEEVTKFLKQQDDRKFVQEFIMGLVKKAKIEAFADDFKQFVPPSEEKKPAPKPVAKPAKKAVESQAVKLEKKVESAKKDANNAIKQAPVSKPISKPTPAPVEKPTAK